MLTYNHSVLTNNGSWLTDGSATPPVPSDEVTIGTQTWKKSNLKVDDGLGGIYTQTVNYGQGDVVEYYYTWDAAVRIAASIPGWHLPTTNEWDTLAAAVGGTDTAGTKLKSTYGWGNYGGTDDFGFTAFPAGNWNSSFKNLYSDAWFWTSSQMNSTYAYVRYFNLGTTMISNNRNKTSYAYSIRLIKD